MGRVIIEDKVKIDRSVIKGPCIIGEGSIITDTYIGPYTSVGYGCQICGTEVEDSIIMDESRIINAGKIVESLIGRNVKIQEGAHCQKGTDSSSETTLIYRCDRYEIEQPIKGRPCNRHLPSSPGIHIQLCLKSGAKPLAILRAAISIHRLHLCSRQNGMVSQQTALLDGCSNCADAVRYCSLLILS